MKKTIWTMIALTLVTTLAFAQAKPATPPAPAQPQKAADPIVIAAGDLAIRQSEFEGALATLPEQYQQYAQGAGKRQFAEEYLRMKMLAAEGLKGGLDKDPDVVRQLNLMKENLVAQAQLQKIEQGITISDEDLKKKYEADKASFEEVKARHILVAFDGSPAAQADKPKLTDEQAKAKAEELRKQIAGGASFEEIAKKESDDTGSGANGGDLGSFGRGQMVPEFEKAAFEAKPGEITPVIKTQFGYHIIKVESHGATPYDQVKAPIERNLRQERLKGALDAMKDKAKPTYNDSYFAVPAPPPAAEPKGEATKQ